MQLNPTAVTSYGPPEDRSWSASETGTNDCKAGQLDRATLLAIYTDGIVKSGTVLGIITSTGKYGPYLDSATDGRQTAVGFLYDTLDISSTTAIHMAPIQWHGAVYKSKLPKQSGAGSLDAAGIADLGKFDVRA